MAVADLDAGSWDDAGNLETSAAIVISSATIQLFDVLQELHPGEHGVVQYEIDWTSSGAVILVGVTTALKRAAMATATLDFNTGPDEIIRATGEWGSGGDLFEVGMQFLIEDSPNDDGWLVIDAISTTTTTDDTLEVSGLVPDITPLSGDLAKTGVTIRGGHFDTTPPYQINATFELDDDRFPMFVTSVPMYRVQASKIQGAPNGTMFVRLLRDGVDL